jgi:hypothetical protein
MKCVAERVRILRERKSVLREKKECSFIEREGTKRMKKERNEGGRDEEDEVLQKTIYRVLLQDDLVSYSFFSSLVSWM